MAIDRWDHFANQFGTTFVAQKEYGEFVKFSDHEAELKQARQHVVELRRALDELNKQIYLPKNYVAKIDAALAVTADYGE